MVRELETEFTTVRLYGKPRQNWLRWLRKDPVMQGKGQGEPLRITIQIASQNYRAQGLHAYAIAIQLP